MPQSNEQPLILGGKPDQSCQKFCIMSRLGMRVCAHGHNISTADLIAVLSLVLFLIDQSVAYILRSHINKLCVLSVYNQSLISMVVDRHEEAAIDEEAGSEGPIPIQKLEVCFYAIWALYTLYVLK
jgi:hypothetical protein